MQTFSSTPGKQKRTAGNFEAMPDRAGQKPALLVSDRGKICALGEKATRV